jgi:predicted nucleic-acid-binding protein
VIAFDTNLLVRLLVRDDASQTERSLAILEEASAQGEPVFVSDVVLCEVEWVIEAAYGVPRKRILAAVQSLAADDRFAFEDRSRIRLALDLYQQGRGDLADYFIGLAGERAGARTTWTFDRALRADPRFTVL